ncbi:phage related protein [Devosia sp. DBB001]|nr:phage related protein [Devosia sp. DBB001]
MSEYSTYMIADARLVILKELKAQTDGRLNETILTSVLDTFGYRKSRDWVRTQLRAMADVGAVAITEVGSVLIAEITRAGLDHVDRRTVIEGIARPSPGA